MGSEQFLQKFFHTHHYFLIFHPMIGNKLVSLAFVAVALVTAQAMTVAAHDLGGSVSGSALASVQGSLNSQHGLKLGHLSTDAKAALKAKHQAEVKDNDDRDDKNDDKKTPKKKLDGPCMSTAVDVRDTAMINAYDSYSVSVKAALTARRAALKAAWLIADTEAREDAVLKAWVDFRASLRAARRTLHDARSKAWEIFKEIRKTCGGGKEANEKPASGDAVDAQL